MVEDGASVDPEEARLALGHALPDSRAVLVEDDAPPETTGKAEGEAAVHPQVARAIHD